MAVTITMTGLGTILSSVALSRQYGKYVSTGSGTGTYVVSGGYVVEIMFFDNNNNLLDTSTTPSVSVASAYSNGITTLTITAGATAVTNGSFLVTDGGD